MAFVHAYLVRWTEGIGLSDEAVRVAVALRLEITVGYAYITRAAVVHSWMLRNFTAWFANIVRHNALNDVIAHALSFLPRDALYCKARYCDRMSSVCLSVRLSVCDVGGL